MFRVRPIPFWRLIPDTIGCSCTDTDTDTGNDINYSLGQTYLTYVAHTVRTFQNITPLTLRFKTFETNYRLETIGVRATVLTVETGKWTTGIGTDTKISIRRHRYPPILASIGRYPIPDTGIGLTLIMLYSYSSQHDKPIISTLFNNAHSTTETSAEFFRRHFITHWLLNMIIWLTSQQRPLLPEVRINTTVDEKRNTDICICYITVSALQLTCFV